MFNILQGHGVLVLNEDYSKQTTATQSKASKYCSLNLQMKYSTCERIKGRQRILKYIFVNVSVYQQCNSYNKFSNNGLINHEQIEVQSKEVHRQKLKSS